MAGQLSYGQSGKYTDYEALYLCLKTIDCVARDLKRPLYVPYGLGCGLAGGDWEIVYPLITEHCPSATIVKLN